MAASRTPRRDAVEAWLRCGDPTAAIPWPIGEPERPVVDDPLEWQNADARLEAALMQCGGARAELPTRPTNPTPPAHNPPKWWWRRRKEKP